MVQATASAGAGTVASVEFWLNDEPISWDSAPPYNVTLSSLPPGRYRLVSRVSDTTGNSTTTPAVNFRVLAPDDADPQPSIAGGFLSLTYFRFTDGSVSYATQRSGDLGAWNPILPTETTLLTYPTIEVRKATDPVPLGSDARRFLRMQIATP